MDNIFEATNTFPFDKLVLSSPISRSGGSYFIRFSINNKPVYIQPPKCLSRNGIVNTNKKFLIDLMFNSENGDFIQWLENLEDFCHNKIFQSREEWFEGDLELSDIENYFTSPIKLFKSGKYYLVRVDIPTALGKPQLTVYDEQEEEVEFDQITSENEVMTILEIQGIKCSPRSFQIMIEIKQMMKLEKKNLFSKCLFKSSSNLIESKDESLTASKEEIVIEEKNEHNNNEICDNENEKEKTSELVPTLENALIVADNREDMTTDEIEISNNLEEPIENNESVEENEEKISNEGELHNFSNGLEEIDLVPTEEEETFEISERKDVYYKMYKDARKKAKLAKELALASYLEARRIKNTYMLESIEDSDDSEEEVESLDN
uniref:Uncharacterized protein n=1 Tax=viral metagenome TaxID=1070528 RepID=A0A6C0C1L8_9ZZZZ